MAIIIILLVIAILLFIIGSIVKAGERRTTARDANNTPSPASPSLKGAGLVALILAIIVTFVQTFVVVSANTVSVEVAYGSPHGVIDNGIHWKYPWVSTVGFSTRIQTTAGDSSGDGCISVKADGVQGCVIATIRWKINYDRTSSSTRGQSQARILQLWRDYGNFSDIQSSLVQREAESIFAIVYGKLTAENAFSGNHTAQILSDVKAGLNNELAPYGLYVDGVTIGNTELDAASQSRLNALFIAAQNVQIAHEQALAALQEAQANYNLAKSLTTPILIQRCFDAAEQIPDLTVLNCFPGSSTQTPVIVNSK